MEKNITINGITITSLVLYGDSAEQFVVALPYLMNAHKRWVAKSKGLSGEEADKVAKMGVKYQELSERLEKAKTEELSEEQQADLNNQLVVLTTELHNINNLGQMITGLDDETLKQVEILRGEYIKIRNNILEYVCAGLKKEDKKTLLLKIKEVSQWTNGQKDRLIWAVSAEMENGIPTDFLSQLNQVLMPWSTETSSDLVEGME